MNANFNNLPNKSKLIWLMSSEDNFIIKNTSSLLCSLCEFWKTVKPFFSKKGNCGEQKIVLFENDKIVNNPNEVSNHFNIFFPTV